MSRKCVCGCWKFTSASIGERLHPRHASSLSGQERDGEQKDGGESWGAGRGAWKRGQRVGQLIWAGAQHYTEARVLVGGVTTLTFHVSSSPPLPTPPPYPPFHPRHVSLSGFHDDPVAVALQPKKHARA